MGGAGGGARLGLGLGAFRFRLVRAGGLEVLLILKYLDPKPYERRMWLRLSSRALPGETGESRAKFMQGHLNLGLGPEGSRALVASKVQPAPTT